MSEKSKFFPAATEPQISAAAAAAAAVAAAAAATRLLAARHASAAAAAAAAAECSVRYSDRPYLLLVTFSEFPTSWSCPCFLVAAALARHY